MSDIQNYLPSRFKSPDQTFNQALIKAFNEGSQDALNLIQACIDQFFLTTATGKYLVQLGEEAGFVMPSNSGLDIRAYRVLVPLMVSAPKQVRKTFEETIEAFYNANRTRPSITSTVYEPYSLLNGDDLFIETEKGMTKVGILASNVSDITSVSSSELAAVINSTQNNVFADSVADRLTGRRYLRLTCTTAGTTAHVRLVGGTAQNVLKFPNIIPTEQTAGCVWEFTKEQAYSDVLRAKWVGGINPKLYLVKQGDIVTIRGLDDYLSTDIGKDAVIRGSESTYADIVALHPTNEINDLYVAEDTGKGYVWNGASFLDVGILQSLVGGSYEILDSGYDYFVVRNTKFLAKFMPINQPLDNTFFFTSQVRVNIYDNAEYGLVSETENNTATITIPAIPPLARRFLSGSSHLHGAQLKVLSFTRNSLTVLCPPDIDKPIGENLFVLKGKRMMYNFKKPAYKTISVDNASDPAYLVQSSDDSFSMLPFTSAISMGENAIHGEVNSEFLTITFDYPHGLIEGWEFTLSDVEPIANLTTTIINDSFITNKIVSPYKIVCRLTDKSLNNTGMPIKFAGVQFGTFDIKRYQTLLSDGSDFYLDFPSEQDVIDSGLDLGMTFMIQPDSGQDVNLFYSDFLKHRRLQVRSIIGNRVNIVTGLGVGNPVLITRNALGNRSADFGGASPKYHFDQTSEWNVENVMGELTVCFKAYSPSKNPAYISSYLYDPQGVKTYHTVSKYITNTTDDILRGSNPGVIFVSKVSNLTGGISFPSSGTMMLDYGTDAVEGPISYIAVIDGGENGFSQIIIDPSYRFQKTHKSGGQVQYIHANTPYIPKIDGAAYPVYVTGTAQARNTLFKLLEGLVAGGVFLQPDVLIPKLRYQDPAIEPFA